MSRTLAVIINCSSYVTFHHLVRLYLHSPFGLGLPLGEPQACLFVQAELHPLNAL